MLATLGVAGAFYLNALGLLAVRCALAVRQFGERPVARQDGKLAGPGAGFTYRRGEPQLRMVITRALIPLIFATPYQTMLTIFAQDVLHSGGWLGALSASSGVDTLLGALMWRRSRDRPSPSHDA